MGSLRLIVICLPCALLFIATIEAVYNCSIYGDPHLRTYKDARGMILLPCRFKATRFVMQINGQNKWCETNIFVTGRVYGGGVYTGSVEIEIAIFDANGPIQSTGFLISDNLLHSSPLPVMGKSSPLPWGTNQTFLLDVAVITWTFNTAGAILSVPVCGFSMVYRLRTARPSGIVISVSDNAVISPGYQEFSLCGNLDDSSHTLIDQARSLQLETAKEALAYSIMKNDLSNIFAVGPELTNQLHPVNFDCEYTKSYMKGRGCIARPSGLKTCLGIFKKRRLLKCLYETDEVYPIEAFFFCMILTCETLEALNADFTSNCHSITTLRNTCVSRLTPRLQELYKLPFCQ